MTNTKQLTKIITPNVLLDLNHVVSLQVFQGNDKTAVEVRYRSYEREVFTDLAAEDIANALKVFSESSV